MTLTLTQPPSVIPSSGTKSEVPVASTAPLHDEILASVTFSATTSSVPTPTGPSKASHSPTTGQDLSKLSAPAREIHPFNESALNDI